MPQDSHRAYWVAHGDGSKEPWRFEEGFALGWDDALAFSHRIPASSTFPIIGFLGHWTGRRTAQHIQEKGASPQVWEFETGFEQGVKAVESALAK